MKACWLATFLAALGVSSLCAADLMPSEIRRYTSDSRTVSRAYELPWSQLRAERMEKVYREWQTQLPNPRAQPSAGEEELFFSPRENPETRRPPRAKGPGRGQSARRKNSSGP